MLVVREEQESFEKIRGLKLNNAGLEIVTGEE